EARAITEEAPDRAVGVTGVDRGRSAEGLNVDESSSVTFTSMVKRVDVSVQDITNRALEGDFPGGENVVYGLEEDAIDIADTNEEAYTDDIKEEVDEWREKILDGDVEVPQTHEELEEFEDNL